MQKFWFFSHSPWVTWLCLQLSFVALHSGKAVIVGTSWHYLLSFFRKPFSPFLSFFTPVLPGFFNHKKKPGSAGLKKERKTASFQNQLFKNNCTFPFPLTIFLIIKASVFFFFLYLTYKFKLEFDCLSCLLAICHLITLTSSVSRLENVFWGKEWPKMDGMDQSEWKRG